MSVNWTLIASVTTAGGAGVATGDSGIVSGSSGGFPSGILTAIYIDFTSMPATCDVTISEVMPNDALRTLLVTTDKNTDGVFIVKIPTYSTAGVVSASDLAYPVVARRFKVTVAQADAITNGVSVYFQIME